MGEVQKMGKARGGKFEAGWKTVREGDEAPSLI